MSTAHSIIYFCNNYKVKTIKGVVCVARGLRPALVSFNEALFFHLLFTYFLAELRKL